MVEPVWPGPPLLRSICALPQGRFTEQLLALQEVALAAEFTSMLCDGPPTMAMVPLPWIFNALCCGVDCGLCGSSTTMGIGAVASSAPHTENARTSFVVEPLSRPAKNVCTCSRTSTRMKGVAAMALGGLHPVPQPITDDGKLTLTRLPGKVLLLLYPFLAA